ncbi:hypothetical protein [Tropicibacter sp. S64]|uniref:hypothetical protein n=1 Tax=Tropicibacter sp. S64 TaxID=3415122 RepID=UPI003C7A8497
MLFIAGTVLLLASSAFAVSAASKVRAAETIGDLETSVCRSEFKDVAKSLYGLGGYRSVTDFYVAEYETNKTPAGFGTVIEGMVSLARRAATVRNADRWDALHACLSRQLGGKTQ